VSQEVHSMPVLTGSVDLAIRRAGLQQLGVHRIRWPG